MLVKDNRLLDADILYILYLEERLYDTNIYH